mgnify:CR=1 FL=1
MENQKNTLRVYMLSGELIDFPVDPSALLDYQAMSEKEAMYFIKELIEEKSVEMGIRPPLRFHRLYLSKPDEDDDRFDYMAMMDPLTINECILYNNEDEKEENDEKDIRDITIRVSKLAHVLDVGDWLEDEEVVNVNHLTFEYNISSTIKDGMINDLCRIISLKRPPRTLTWNISANRTEVFPEGHYYIDDFPLQNFQSVHHLIVKSNVNEDIIRIIQHYLKHVNELTIRFNPSVSMWSSLLAATSVQTLHIEYSPSFVSYDKRGRYFNEFKKVTDRIEHYFPEWELFDNDSKILLPQTANPRYNRGLADFIWQG